MVDFIQSNPFSDRLRKNEQTAQQSRLRDVQIRSAETGLANEAKDQRRAQAIDAATRRAVQGQAAPAPTRSEASGAPAASLSEAGGAQAPTASASPAAPAVAAGQPTGLRRRLSAELAQVPGGGAQAAEYALKDLDQQQTVMAKTFEIAAQNPDMALQYAEANGMPVPADMAAMIRNRQVAGWMASMMRQAVQMYPGAINAKRRWAFFQAQIQGLDQQLAESGGQVPQAVAQGTSVTPGPAPAVPPQEAVKPTIETFFDQDTGREYKAQFDPATNTWTRIGGVEAPPAGKAPSVQSFYDPQTGREYKAQWNPETNQWETVGGVEAESSTALDQRIQRLVETGVPYEIATGIATGRYAIDRDQLTGAAQIVDKATGRVLYKTGAGGPPQPGQEQTGAAAAPPAAGTAGGETQGPLSLWEMAKRGLVAGPGPTIEEGYATVAPWVGMEGGQEVLAARQTFRTETQNLIRALAINPRFPVAEMNRIKEEVDLSPSIFDSSIALTTRMRSIDASLRSRLANAMRDAADPSLPVEMRRAQASNARAIAYFLDRMDVPPEAAGDEEIGLSPEDDALIRKYLAPVQGEQ